MEKYKANLGSRIFTEESDPGDPRSPFLHDRDRILYSRAFRRLSSKTQVVTASGIITSDHIRNRLTHSLEVMQVASTIALGVNKNLESTDYKSEIDMDLIQSIALGHDIGHTAYGHVGEEALFKFIFNTVDNNQNFNEISGKLHQKIRHSFQSLKVCCFLEKPYKPEFPGLNLTVATLDGILKHSKLDKNEREFYKAIFDSYKDKFWDDKKNIDGSAKQKLEEFLFEFVSPVTCEGIIVSIADEIAQLCHDIEDIRRLGRFESVKGFYDVVNNKICTLNGDLDGKSKTFSDNFCQILQEVDRGSTDKIAKLERLYVKLILSLCIPVVTKGVINLCNMDEEQQDELLKEKYFGTFEDLKMEGLTLNLESEDISLIELLEEIYSKYTKETLMKLPDVARWDIKGREVFQDLANKLYEAFKPRSDNQKINLAIIRENQGDLEKSFEVGKEFVKNNSNFNGRADIPIKFAVWDYLAGMTDSFMIKEYESLTFKRVELR